MKKGCLLSMVCVGVMAVGLLVGCDRRGDNTESPGESAESHSETAQGSGESDGGDAQEETREPVDWMQGGYQMPRGVEGHRECSCVNA